MQPSQAPAGDDSGTATSKSRGTRSRSGCVVCRARKVKCDERPGTCLNCETLSLECPGYGPGIVHRPPHLDPTTEPHRDLTEAGTKRKRTYRSCRECRTSKTRCSGQRPVCLRCSQKGVECLYDAEPTPAWARTVNTIQSHENSLGDAPSAVHEPNPSYAAATPPHRPENSAPPSVARSPPQPPPIARTPPALDETNSMSTSVSATGPDEPAAPEPLAWLVSPRLPNDHHVRKLVDVYFTNIHPLRCFGFIHKPTYMQRLDEGLSTLHPTENALLLIMCALGAKFFALDYSSNYSPLSSDFILSAGNAWAKQAKRLIFDDLGDITLENLMASVLLQDHELRTGNYANAFMVTATAVRMAQALQVNLEHSTDILCSSPSPSPTASSKESRRRLMWSCFIMDCWVGSGVDQLTLLDEHDIKIQLPCQEQNFILQIPCITETIDGKMLDFLGEDMRSTRAVDNMGLLAFFIQLTGLRKKVLKYVKHLDSAQPPWHPESQFAQLTGDIQHWHDTLPTNIQFTPTTIYMRKETSQLGALFLLHCTYHQTMVDLYRIGMPRLFKVRSPISFPTEQYGFLLHCQHTCFEFAKNVAVVIAEAVRHGPGALADSWLWVITYDSVRIMLYYLTQVVKHRADQGGPLMTEAIPLFQTSLKALKMMTPLFTTAQRCYDSAVSMLRKAGFGPSIVEENGTPEVPSHLNDIDENSAPGTPHVSPEQVLNPLAIYRLARKAVRERHVTEPAQSPLFSMSNPHSNMPSPVHLTNNNNNTTNNTLSPPPSLSHPHHHHHHQHQHHPSSENQLPPLNTTFDQPPPPAFTPLPSFNTPGAAHDGLVAAAADAGPLLDNLDDFEMFSIIDFDGPWQLAGAAMDNAIGS